MAATVGLVPLLCRMDPNGVLSRDKRFALPSIILLAGELLDDPAIDLEDDEAVGLQSRKTSERGLLDATNDGTTL